MDGHPPPSSQPLDADVAAMAFVQASSLCQGLAAEQLSLLFARGRVLQLGAGEHVYEEGATDDALYIVLGGKVSLRARGAGVELELATLERQAVFGEAAVLTSRPRMSSAVVRADARLIEIPGEVVRRVADEAPKLGRRHAALMAARQRGVGQKA